MHGRRRSVTIAAAASALFVVLALTSYVIAEKNIRAEVSRFQSAASGVDIAGRSSFDARLRPLATIHYEDLARYVEAFQRNNADMKAAIARLAEGRGMGFWTEGRRQALAGDLNGLLQRDKESSDASESALAAERPRHLLVVTASNDSQTQREQAVAVLAPETDEGGYSGQLTSLTTGMGDLTQKRLDLEQAQRKLGTATIDVIRHALCAAMIDDLERERLAIAASAARIEKARSVLRDYKSVLKARLDDTRGLIVILDRVAELQPAVDYVFTNSATFRDFMHRVSEPIPDGGLSRLFSAYGKPVTMLSIAAGIDPQVEAAGDVLVLSCAAIETAHREVGLIVTMVAPLSSATTAFIATNSRSDMLTLIGKAPSAAAYFEMHSTLFDPAVARINSLRPYVGLLQVAAINTNSGVARFVLVGMSKAAQNLIDLAVAPLERGRAFIVDAGASLRSLERLEQAYRAEIGNLRSDALAKKVA